MLRIAIWEDRIIEVNYRNQTGQTKFRALQPLGLVFKAGIWYCVAQHEGNVSTFRTERILSANLLPARFMRPKRFKLDDYWRDNQARYESKARPCIVSVVGALKDLEQLAVFWPSRIESADNPARVRAEVQFQLPGQAVHELLAWSSLVEVESPLFVREDILQRLQAATKRYSGRTLSSH